MSDNDRQPPQLRREQRGRVPNELDAAASVAFDAAAGTAAVDAGYETEVDEAVGAAEYAAADLSDVDEAAVDAAGADSDADDDPALVGAAQGLSPFQVVSDELDDPHPHLQGEHEANRLRREQALEAANGYYYEDTSDSDDETNVVDQGQEVLNPRGAAALMVDVMYTYRRYRIRNLTVDLTHNVPDDWRLRNTGRNGDDNDEYAIQFGNFVNALEDSPRIRKLHVTRGNFWHDPLREDDDNDNDNDNDDEDDDGVRPVDGFDPNLRLEGEDLDMFFGEVLPFSLREITISHSRIEPQYWRLFTEQLLTLPASKLSKLALQSTPLNAEGCRLLRNVLRREGSLYELSTEDCGLGADEWHMVCEGVAENGETHTLTLIERNVTVRNHTLLPVLARTSGVDRLVVHAAAWADDDNQDDGAFVCFIRELRLDNGGISELDLRRADREFPHLAMVEEILSTYNWSLDQVVLHPAPINVPMWAGRINSLLERNRRARSLSQLFDRKPPYGLQPVSMWPLVLQEHGRFPTRVYRFLRKRNVEAFCEHAQTSVVTTAAPAPAAAPRENRARDDAIATTITTTTQKEKKRPHQHISE